jgi:hypothetical protein
MQYLCIWHLRTARYLLPWSSVVSLANQVTCEESHGHCILDGIRSTNMPVIRRGLANQGSQGDAALVRDTDTSRNGRLAGGAEVPGRDSSVESPEGDAEPAKSPLIVKFQALSAVENVVSATGLEPVTLSFEDSVYFENKEHMRPRRCILAI